MSQVPPVPDPPPNTPTTPSPSARRRSGVGGFFRGLFLILFSALVGIVGAGALAFYLFGYRPETPAQASQVAQIQGDLASLQQQNALLQTEVVALNGRSASNTEQSQDLDKRLGDLRSEVQALSTLSDQMREYAAAAATVQVEARDSRTAVALNSSLQATRFAQLDLLNQRTERLGRFLERLSDISGDAAADVGAQSVTSTSNAAPSSTTPTAASLGSATPTSTALTTASPSATISSSATISATISTTLTPARTTPGATASVTATP